MKSLLFFMALLLQALSAGAAQQTLATISDPLGDDNGSGTLTYPQRTDFQVGDLDLRQLQISRDEEGFWFAAMFKNDIRNPKDVPYTVGAESLANFARKGFYQFNVDIYIDTDRVPGSGNTFTLPGRQVSIDPHFAWERAVILTPRPEMMRQQLLDALAEQLPERASVEIAARVDQSIIFPTRIRVHGKSIAFFVPASFFSGSDGTAWAVTALVTGALTTIPFDLSLSSTTKAPLDRLQLGVMQPVAGHPKETFGYNGGAMPSPVVDMLGSTVEQQVLQLAKKDGLTGVSWGPHAVNDAPRADAENETSVVERKPAGSINAKPVVSIGDLFQLEKPTVAKPADAKPAEVMPLADPSIARRLQTLQQLFDQKLIDEADYKQQKQRILGDL